MKKNFIVGEIVRYSHPTTFFIRAFGRRIFTASSESLSLSDEYKRIEEAEARGDSGLLDLNFGAVAIPPEEGVGIVLCTCYEPLHGAGTSYNKILLGERLYWIASEHLEKVYFSKH